MAHNFLTDDVVSLESLDMFEAELVAAKHTDRKFEAIFGTHGGSNRSDNIRIRKPNFVEIRRGWDANWKDLDEQYTNLTFGEPIGVDLMLTEKEMHMDLSSEGKQLIQPVLNRLAHEIDAMVIDEVMTAPNYVGAPGTNPSALSTYLNGVAVLRDFCIPDEDLLLALSPQMEVDAVDFLKGLYQDDSSLASQYKTGRVRRAAGLKWASTQQTKTHVTGTVAGAGLVKGANQSGASVNSDDWTATQTGVLKRNDIVSFPGCYAVNPITKQSTGRLATFRVTQDIDSNSTGANEAVIYIDPPIVLSGPNQNVSAAPDDDGAIQLFGHISSYASKTARQGLMWHKSAVALAFQRLDNPNGEGAKGRAVTDEKLGLSIRYTRAWDIDRAKWKLRWDVWPAMKLVRPEWALRVQSGS